MMMTNPLKKKLLKNKIQMKVFYLIVKTSMKAHPLLFSPNYYLA